MHEASQGSQNIWNLLCRLLYRPVLSGRFIYTAVHIYWMYVSFFEVAVAYVDPATASVASVLSHTCRSVSFLAHGLQTAVENL